MAPKFIVEKVNELEDCLNTGVSIFWPPQRPYPMGTRSIAYCKNSAGKITRAVMLLYNTPERTHDDWHARKFQVIAELSETQKVTDILAFLYLWPQQNGYRDIGLEKFQNFEYTYFSEE